MFNKHVVKKLSAYCNGELPAEESNHVGEHLLACERCRKEHDDIKLGVHLASQLPIVEAPSELWSEIDALLDARSRKAAFQPKPARSWFGLPAFAFVATGALVLIVAVGASVWLLNYAPGSTWPVVRYGVGSDEIKTTTRLAVGGVLETDGSSRALLDVGQIGTVELEPNSRVRLIETQVTEHRIALDRGKIHAKIWAPPRLFFVDTPSAVAIDLGCAYTLEVDDAGRGFLHVTSGWVALARDGRESFVPIGAMCETRPGIGPGTPYFEDASDLLIEALAKFDFESAGEEALKLVLAESRDRDTFTLWHLLSRVDESQRSEILDRMIELVGLPKGVTREAVMQLDSKTLELWKDELDTVWF
ncbi:MAG: zf-HC2 domain-containing protein [Acidobacteriota bacterium]